MLLKSLLSFHGDLPRHTLTIMICDRVPRAISELIACAVA